MLTQLGSTRYVHSQISLIVRYEYHINKYQKLAELHITQNSHSQHYKLLNEDYRFYVLN